ncbi:MAG: class I SAM-dependent methyltransferase [Synergistaceae bacterium]|nr:class I SAM-dependent methyltransferase [Synergistaceae bacterium]
MSVNVMPRPEFENMIKTQDKHFWFQGKRRIIDKIIKTKVYRGAALKILEIGSGTGANLPVLSKYGHVTAVEYDDYARSFIKADANVSVKSGYLPDGLDEIKNNKFDLICLFDVLEHIEDDNASLEAINNYLKPHGKFFMTVPAYQFMYSKHDKLLGHYRRDTLMQVKNLCAAHGFKILYAGYFNCLLFPLMLAARVADKFATGGGGEFRLWNIAVRA